MIKFRYSASLAALAALCSVAGCSHSQGPKCFPVRGQVFYKGKPLADAELKLLSDTTSGPEMRPLVFINL